MEETRSYFYPALAVAIGILLLSIMDAMVKYYGTGLFIAQIVFLRMAFGAVTGLGLFATAGASWPTAANLRSNLLRSIIMLGAAGGFFYAVTVMPLMEAVTIAFVSPIFVVILAGPVLGERASSSMIVAVLLGFAGVVLTSFGGFDTDNLNIEGSLAALFAAFMYALGLLLLRSHSQRMKLSELVAVQNVVMALLIAPAGMWFWEPVPINVIAGFAMIGVLAIIGHVIMAWAFSKAPAGRLAPFEYTNMIWAGFLGFAFFQEVPPFTTLFGAGLIAFACWIANRK